jgi:hypothetical protein
VSDNFQQADIEKADVMVGKSYLAGATIFLWGLAATVAQAEVVRCEVANPIRNVMPEWIEYEVNARGTVVNIRDSLRVGLGIDWVEGEVESSGPSQQIYSWDEGFLPTDVSSVDNARVEMRLTRLANGDVSVSAAPTDINTLGQSYQSRATCTP